MAVAQARSVQGSTRLGLSGFCLSASPVHLKC